MTAQRKPAALLFAAIIGAFFLFALMRFPERAPQSSSVGATIFPVYDIARNIAAGAVEVTLILPPGAEPHAYEPPPSVIRSLQQADVVYAIGYGIDDWIDPILASGDAVKITVDEGIALRSSPDDAESMDPHYWLSVPNAKRIAATIATDLSERFPNDAKLFSANLHAYETALDRTDAKIRALLADVPARDLITFHDAWYYFADEYGLRIAGTFEPAPGREPSPKYLASLKEAVRSAGVKTIYTEPLFSSDVIATFAKDNKLRLSALDDIGGSEGRMSYISLMLANAKTISDNQR